MFFNKLQNRWVITEENATTQIRKTIKIWHQTYKHHTQAHVSGAKVELASHTSMLTVYQPCFYFLLNLSFCVKSLINRNAVQSHCWLRIGMKKKKKKPIKGLTSGYISRSIHVKCLQSWRNSDTEWILTESLVYTCTRSLQIMASPPSCRLFNFSPAQLRI